MRSGRAEALEPAQGLDALGYAEHVDYDLVESTNPAFQKAIVRVNVFRDHRQVGLGASALFPSLPLVLSSFDDFSHHFAPISYHVPACRSVLGSSPYHGG